jgi:hypothetical protein
MLEREVYKCGSGHVSRQNELLIFTEAGDFFGISVFCDKKRDKPYTQAFLLF